jgi:PfpI family intracellular protease
MSSRRRTLKGRRIAVLAADGFEKVELTVPLRALRAAGAKVDVVSLRRGRIRGLNLNLPATRVRVDRTVEQAGAGDYDGLLVPGGFINPDLLRQSAPARGLVREFVESGKPVVTLCHGPWVLASAGVLQGRTVTSWAGIRDDVVNAGRRGSTRRSCARATSPPAGDLRTWRRSYPRCSTPTPPARSPRRPWTRLLGQTRSGAARLTS